MRSAIRRPKRTTPAASRGVARAASAFRNAADLAEDIVAKIDAALRE
jgi:hypothetical protein